MVGVFLLPLRHRKGLGSKSLSKKVKLHFFSDAASEILIVINHLYNNYVFILDLAHLVSNRFDLKSLFLLVSFFSNKLLAFIWLFEGKDIPLYDSYC